MGLRIKRLFVRFNNFYILFAVFFIIWMLFFDNNNFYEQYLRNKKLADLEREKIFYIKGKEQIQQNIKELSSSPELFEKFAREKYMMKKDDEDLYILENE